MFRDLGGLAGGLTSDLGPPTDVFGGGSSSGAGGGGGLMAALDVMAFTNDLDLPAVDGSTVAVSVATISAPVDHQDPFINISEDPLRQMVFL